MFAPYVRLLRRLLHRALGAGLDHGADDAHAREVGDALRKGWIAPEDLEVRIGDLARLRTRLGALDSETRTLAIDRGDELPDLRSEVLAKVRAALLPIAG